MTWQEALARGCRVVALRDASRFTASPSE